MEMSASVKFEVGSESRHLCPVEGDATVAKCLKRRRRSPPVVALSCNDDQQVLQQQPQVVQSTTTTATTTTVKRSSRFRGVSRHRWTGRYEAHLWDKGSWNATQKKKGKQVYLGAYDEEESAARAYDLAAIKYWGTSTFTNFPVSDYEKEVEIMENVTKEEYLASLRRRSSGFSRGVSKYRGVARHHHNGRWEARIGRVFGNKYLYLGTYSTQEEAAHAYDIAAIEYRGINAVTNFDLSTYIRWLRSGAPNSSLTSQNPISSSQPVQTTFNQDNLKEPKFSFESNPSTFRNLGIRQNHEVLERKMPISPSNNSPSSPTALGVLLRSSMFKELVEKNLNAADEEIEGTERKKFKSQTDGDDEFGGIFNYSGNGNVPYVSPSIVDLESLEENTLPLFNPTGQSLWNGSLNISSRH